MGHVWDSVDALVDDIGRWRRWFALPGPGMTPNRLVLTSGGFDCIHAGHVRYLRASAEMVDGRDENHFGRLVVLVNDDPFLIRKKGYVFMPAAERAEIVAAIAGVTDVLVWEDDTQFVDRAILLLRPDIFAKGGDRSTPEQVALCERMACEKVGCRVEYGVGGADKIQSSSALVGRSQVRAM